MSTTPTIRTVPSHLALRLGAMTLAAGATLCLLAGVTQIAEIQAQSASTEVQLAQNHLAAQQVVVVTGKRGHSA